MLYHLLFHEVRRRENPTDRYAAAFKERGGLASVLLRSISQNSLGTPSPYQNSMQARVNAAHEPIDAELGVS